MLSHDVALEQLQLLYDYYDIIIDEASGNQKTVLEDAEKRLIRSIRQGRLTIEEKDGLKITQTVSGGVVLEYKEMSGRHNLQIKGREDENYKKIYSLIGSLTGVGLTAISNLKGKDLATATQLGLVFLYV